MKILECSVNLDDNMDCEMTISSNKMAFPRDFPNRLHQFIWNEHKKFIMGDDDGDEIDTEECFKINKYA